MYQKVKTLSRQAQLEFLEIMSITGHCPLNVEELDLDPQLVLDHLEEAANSNLQPYDRRSTLNLKLTQILGDLPLDNMVSFLNGEITVVPPGLEQPVQQLIRHIIQVKMAAEHRAPPFVLNVLGQWAPAIAKYRIKQGV